MIDLKTQFLLLLYAILSGIYLGASYDLVYYFILIHLRKTLKFVLDICFFVIQGCIIFTVIYKISDGIIPFYCYGIMIVSFLLYYRFANQYYEKNLFPFRKLIYYFINKLLKVLRYIFVKPFVDTYLFLKQIFSFLIKKLIGCGKYVTKKITIQKMRKKLKINQDST